MKTVTKILVPVDFSETSKNAVRMAFEWSNLLKCEVTLLCAYRLIQNNEHGKALTARQIRETIINRKHAQLEQLKSEIDFSIAHEVKSLFELGFMPNCIERVVKEEKIDLIIYGLKPKSIPNTNVDLIRSLQDDHTPFLIVHGNYKTGHFGSIKDLETNITSLGVSEFIENFNHLLIDLERSPNTCFLVHPSEGQTKHSLEERPSIVDRIVNFSKTN